MAVPYFKKLFDYDAHANLAIIDTMLTSGYITGKAANLMAHTLAAQQTWLLRCKNHPLPTGPQWPEWTAEEMKEMIGANHRDWIAYLDSLADADLDQSITFKNLRGDTYTDVIRDVLAHLINHGTHHRAQAGQQLKFAGIETLPVTDLIFYVRGI